MKELFTALKINVLFIVLTGGLFPLVVWGIAQLLMPFQANGSLIRNAQGTLIGSALIGQQFADVKYFHGRPSAAGAGYDAANSGGTNLGPTSSKLFTGIKDDPSTIADESFSGVGDLASAYRQENNLPDKASVPVDAVTRSASGLDPDISPANAMLQAKRVADSRNLSLNSVVSMITDLTERRYLGIYGEPRVNVLLLNLKLDATTVK